MRDQAPSLNFKAYSSVALPHLERVLEMNANSFDLIARRLIQDVRENRSLFVFGSGHSVMLPLELYHRAGGPSFVIPLVADFLLPTAGPPVVRLLERIPGSANFLLDRAQVQRGEMLWLMSQSGINASVVDLAFQAQTKGIFTVAFTSKNHSQSVQSRHPSGKRLFEVCDEVIDLGGERGDAAVPLNDSVAAGPLSTLASIFLAHSLLCGVLGVLENSGTRCTYTSVNTPEGEARNKELERQASLRDNLLR